MVSRYITNGNGTVNVKHQEGMCLVPPHHYRMIQQQRSEGYAVSTPPGPYVSQPPAPVGNQGPTLRGPPGAPNQSSTPPNVTDIKVPTLSQQPSLNPMFVSQPIRAQQSNYFARSTGPNQAPPRMGSTHRPQHIFPSPPQPYMHIGAPQQVYIAAASNSIPYGFGQRAAASSYVSQVPVYPSIYSTYTPQTQTQSVPYPNYYPHQMIQRPNSIPPATAANPNTTPNVQPSVHMVSNNPPSVQKRRRERALKVIDPATGVDRLEELYEDTSHPTSGESSARQTPQPSSAQSHNKEVQAAFAKQVMQAINDTGPDQQQLRRHTPALQPEDHHAELQFDGQQNNHVIIKYDNAVPQRLEGVPGPQQQQHPQFKMEHVVQASKLQAEAKEFVLPQATAKETPIVSANIDAVEVTLPNKLPKDRESPVKIRKQREQSSKVGDHNKETTTPVEKTLPPVSIPPNVETVSDIESSIKDEVKPIPEVIPVSFTQPTNPVQVSLVTKDTDVVTKEPVDNKEKQQPKPTNPQQHQPHRKDGKESQTKANLERQDSGSSVSSVQSVPSSDNAKSKQNAQRSASKQSSAAPNNNQKTATAAPVVIPQPQPAKPASKSNKKNELNLKGANKEGTDMDAFNDNSMRTEVNSNVIPNQTVGDNDIINANSLPPTTISTNATPVPMQPPPTLVRDVTVDTNNKKFEDEMTIKPPEPVTKPIKNKIDITDIVKDTPNNVKPYNNMMKGQDEPDRATAVPSNDKMVQAKNDVNSKTSEISRIENKLPYADGQWTPLNQNGLKKYQKDFLLAIKELPASRIPPDNIIDAVLADDRARLSDGRLSMGGKTDFNPPFNMYGRNSSQKGPLPSRLSASKMDRVKGNKGSNLKPTISLSVRKEVKLHESENAWRPARLSQKEFPTDDEKKTGDLYKKVRGILNKLTPQKFETLLQQIKNLSIDSSDRLQGVIDLVFEKAVDEPNFSVAYANMCCHLALMQVPTHACTEEKPDYVNFRKLLITRCQLEFEKNSIDESMYNAKVKEIDECTDLEKKKDLEFDLEEYVRRVRMKSVGNIRFIGELFKQGMLTINIMKRCLLSLLDNGDEESLECLCKLLTTVGKEVQYVHKVDLHSIFDQMKNLADKKDPNRKISSRIRFMLQDVIDLRASNWVPRRQDLNPKMMDQIQKEADQEQLNIQLMNSVPMTPRKDDRSGMGTMGDRKGGGRPRNVTDDGWTTTHTRGKNSLNIQSEKLKAGRTPMIDEPFGAPNMFKSWTHGSNMKPSQITNTANKYIALENMESDRHMNSRQGQKEPYHSKGASLERGTYKYDSRGGSRSGSQHRSNDNSLSSSQRGVPAPLLPPQLAPARPSPQQMMVSTAPVLSAALPASEVEVLTDEQRSRRITNSLDEYVSGNCTADEYFADISSAVATSYFGGMISESCLFVLEKSQQARLSTGALFAKLVARNRIPLEDYCEGVEDLLSQADDLKIDIPKIWDYLAEILVHVVIEESVSLRRLHKIVNILIEQRQADQLIAPLFKLVISKKGPSFLHSYWKSSGLQFIDFMDNSRVKPFMEDNHFEFLLSGAAPDDQNHLSYEEIQTKLLTFLKNNRNIDEIHSWVLANVGNKGVQENKFVRALATAIFEDSINKNFKLIPERLQLHIQLLHKYVDNKPAFELECLYALQALSNKMEHPRGLLLDVCNQLYDVGTFSQESFVAWEESQDPAEQEGKGVALKQLTAFFCQLKENDEDGSSGSDQDVEE